MYKLALAMRYLLRRRIAYVSIVAIAFGVMAMIVVNSVMEGFQRRIRDSIYAVDGHLTVKMRVAAIAESPEHFTFLKRRLEPWMEDAGGPIVAIEPRVVLHMAALFT
ncbi:MAG: hypothetical protein KDB53_03325, partial [Planctomycetes bacterium]|nr:hypothetical protein [Planctomycetota bacterium]